MAVFGAFAFTIGHLGFDVLTNRTRTTVNVIGNHTAIVARTKRENAFNNQKAREFSNKI